MSADESPATPPPSLRGSIVAALLSVILGVVSVVLLLKLSTGIPAVVLGWLGLRGLNAAEDHPAVRGTPRLNGLRKLAVAGMVSGLAGVILGIVGIVALTLSRVNESSRRVACMDHLREIGLAVNRYHESHEHFFPQPTINPPPPPAGPAPPYEKRLSWIVAILPYLGKQLPGETGPKRHLPPQLAGLYDRFKLDQTWDAPVNQDAVNTAMPFYLCPSHPTYDPSQKPSPSHYVGIAGVGADAAFLPLDSPHAGFFGYERRVGLGPRAKRDDLPAGTSNTLLAAETCRRNGPWAAGGPPTLRPLIKEDQPYIGLNRQFGGMHPGGGNLLMMDASVQFFAETGNPRVLEKLATLAVDP